MGLNESNSNGVNLESLITIGYVENYPKVNTAERIIVSPIKDSKYQYPIVCTKAGSWRVGNLNLDSLTNGSIKYPDYSGTANTFNTSVITGESQVESESNTNNATTPIITSYLGNNGLLQVPNGQLVFGKTLSGNNPSNSNESFEFQIELMNGNTPFTGQMEVQAISCSFTDVNNWSKNTQFVADTNGAGYFVDTQGDTTPYFVNISGNGQVFQKTSSGYSISVYENDDGTWSSTPITIDGTIANNVFTSNPSNSNNINISIPVTSENVSQPITFYNGIGTVKLTPGQGILLLGLEQGVSYQITEIISESNKENGYTFKTINYSEDQSETPYQNGTGVAGSIDSTPDVYNFVNQYLPGTLTLEKSITAEDGIELLPSDYNTNFTFTVTFKNSDNSPLTGTVDFNKNSGNTPVVSGTLTLNSSGSVQLTMTPSQTIQFIGLPPGTQYSISESPITGFEQIEPESGMNETGTITINEIEEASFINQKMINTNPELSIQKTQAVNNGDQTTDPLQANSGDTIIYEITVTNNGSAPATNVVVTDSVPEGLTYVSGSATPNGSEENGLITWGVGNLEPGDSVTVSFKATVPDVSELTLYINQATVVDSNNIPVDSNEVIVYTHPTPGEGIEKTQSVDNQPPSDNPLENVGGMTVTYYLLVNNVGTTTQTNLNVMDPIPQGFTYVENSANYNGTYKNGIVSWFIPSLEVGGHILLEFKVIVPDQEGHWENTGYLNGVASNTVEIDNPGSLIVKEQSVNNEEKTTESVMVSPGDTITYTITAGNPTDEEMTNVVVTDQIPEGLIVDPTSISNNGVLGANNIITWNLGTLDPHESVELTFSVQVPTTTTMTSWLNDAEIDWDQNPNQQPSQSNQVEAIKSLLDIEKTQSKNGLTPTTSILEVNGGDIVTYYLTIKNTSENPVEDIVVYDTVPEGLTYIENSASNDGINNNGTISWSIDSLESNTLVTVSFQVLVPEVTEYVSWKNIGAVTYGDSQPVDSNEVEIEENPEVNVTVTKAQSVGDSSPTTDMLIGVNGQVVTYYITVTNNSNIAQTNIEVVDPIPEGLMYVPESADNNGIFNQASNSVNWLIPNLNPNASITLSFEVSVPESGGSYINTAYMNGKESNSVEIADTQDIIQKQQGVNDGELTTEQVLVGSEDTITYSIQINNPSSENMTNVIVTDKVPAGLTVIEESLADNAVLENGVITWDVGTLLPGQNITLTFTCSIIDLDQTNEFVNQASMDYNENPLDTPIDSNEVEAVGNDSVHGSDVEPQVKIEKSQSVNNGTISENYLQVSKGDKLTYYLTVSNTGSVSAKNVVINDPIPEGLTIVDGSISNDGQVNTEGNMIVWNIPNIDPGQSVRVQVTFNIPLTSSENRFENTAYVNYEDNEQGNIGSNNVQSGTQTTITPGTGSSSTVTQKVPTTGSSSSTTPSVSSVSSSSPKTGVNDFLIIWLIVFGLAVILLGYQVVRQLKD